MGWTGWIGGRIGWTGCIGGRIGWMGGPIGCIGGRIGWIGGRIGWMGGPIGWMGGRIETQRSFATSTARCASTSPEPVARSDPGPAGLFCLGWQFPAVTSMAVRMRISRISAGPSVGQACLTSAAAPASWGAAAEVPLMAAQPSSGGVSSPAG